MNIRCEGGIRNFLYYTMEVAIKWDEITDDNDNGHGTQFQRTWLDSANIFTVKLHTILYGDIIVILEWRQFK